MNRKPFLIFLHIEKAAGTTFHHILRNNIPYYMTLNNHKFFVKYDGVFSYKMFMKLIHFLPFMNGMGGHTVRRYENYEKYFKNRKPAYITFLREPVSRYLSHYNYQKLTMGINWDINSFMNEGKFNNFQTKKIAGKEDLDKAKEILSKQFDFIGLSEEFDLSLLLLQKTIPEVIKNISYSKRNVLSGKDNRVEKLNGFPEEIKQKIYEKNKLDIELYNFVKDNLFYPRIKEKLGLKNVNKPIDFGTNKPSLHNTTGLLNFAQKQVFERIIVPILY